MNDSGNSPRTNLEQTPGLAATLENVTKHLQASTTAFGELRGSVEALRRDVDDDRKATHDRFVAIAQRIDGSIPPPPGTPPLVKIIGDIQTVAAAAKKSASQHDLDVPAMDARLLRIERELRAQSNVMGVGKKGLRWLFSARGAKTAVSLATLAGALYAAFNAAAHASQAPPSVPVLSAPSGTR